MLSVLPPQAVPFELGLPQRHTLILLRGQGKADIVQTDVDVDSRRGGAAQGEDGGPASDPGLGADRVQNVAMLLETLVKRGHKHVALHCILK